MDHGDGGTFGLGSVSTVGQSIHGAWRRKCLWKTWWNGKRRWWYSPGQQAAGEPLSKRSKKDHYASVFYLTEGTATSRDGRRHWDTRRTCSRQRTQARELQRGENCPSPSRLVISCPPAPCRLFLSPHTLLLIPSPFEFLFLFCFICFCLSLEAHGSLVYQPGLEPTPPHPSTPASEVQSLNLWATRKVPELLVIKMSPLILGPFNLPLNSLPLSRFLSAYTCLPTPQQRHSWWGLGESQINYKLSLIWIISTYEKLIWFMSILNSI